MFHINASAILSESPHLNHKYSSFFLLIQLFSLSNMYLRLSTYYTVFLPKIWFYKNSDSELSPAFPNISFIILSENLINLILNF